MNTDFNCFFLCPGFSTICGKCLTPCVYAVVDAVVEPAVDVK